MTICSRRIRLPETGTHRYHGHTAPHKKKPHGRGAWGRQRTRCWAVSVRSCPLEKAALLLLLARPARARVVSPYLPPGQHAGLTRRGSPVPAVALAPPRRRRGRRRRDGGRSDLRAADPDLEELLEHDLLQVVHHILEHVE